METKSGMLGSKALLALLLISFSASKGAALDQEAAWVHSGGARFGAAITTGDVNCDGTADLIVGSPGAFVFSNDDGKVEIWFGDSQLPPQPLGAADWSASGPSGLRKEFGFSVAAADLDNNGCDDLIVGAPDSIRPRIQLVDRAEVQVFLSFPGALDNFPSWSATGFGAGSLFSLFGRSVAAGDVDSDGIADLIVGEPGADSGQNGEGAVLVWFGGAGFLPLNGTAANADWTAQSNQAGAHLGMSVSSASDLDGDGDDEIFSGAPDFDGPGGVDAGAAFAWFGTPVLGTAPDGTPANSNYSFEVAAASAGAHVGASVTGAGDVNADGFADLVIGAPEFNGTAPGTNNGRAWLVLGEAFGPADNSFDEVYNGDFDQGRLGASVSTAGDINGDGRAEFMIGEPGPGRSKLHIGRSSMLPMSEMVWDEVVATHGATVAPAGDWNGDGFSDVAVGAPVSAPGSGSVRVYLGTGETLAGAHLAAAQMQGLVAGDALGLGMGYAGDINHDGCSDFVGGAPNYEGGQTDEGRVFVTYGSGVGCNFFFELLIDGQRESNQADAHLGWSATAAGDVNGDGFGDVIAGAPHFDGVLCLPFCLPFFPDAGIAHVYLGGPSGMSFTPNTVLEYLLESGAQFGFSVAAAGDVNGDGFGDVIVGAPNATAGASQAGRAFLYLGSASGLGTVHSWSAGGSVANAHFGISVASAGDVNGDGFSDVLIGQNDNANNGKVFLYLGRPTSPEHPQGLGGVPHRTYTGVPGASFGLAVASAGDLNRDGFSDFAVGAPTTSNFAASPFQQGAVYVFHGAATSQVPVAPQQTLTGDDAPGFGQQRFGSGVAGGGDVNGDGFGDLLVGDQWFTGPAGWAQGRAYIFHGNATGVATVAARTFMDCTTAPCDFGRDMSLAGDADGDGFADALIAGYRTNADRGAVYVHLGNGGFSVPTDPGVPLLPLQARAFGGNPLAVLGAATNFFEPSIDLHSPAGRTNVSLELEVKPLGQDFDGQSLTLGAFEDNGLFDRGALTVPIGIGQEAHWRMRLRSASPLFGMSRWIHLPGNAARELDVRMVPEPEALLGLAAGGVTLALLARRRARATRSTRSVG
ncbi:MAG TPA: PEP-CTERM sorting domain-containing protein [Myxococcota bacterium]|nr:PEP-CTERM sorting domain-containing protein [Myxococcota bacterium]